MSGRAFNWGRGAIRLLPRLAMLAVLIALAILALHWLEANLKELGPAARLGTLAGILLVYALLIAVPFVPGVELAITITMMRGPEVAPAIYLSTVFGLMIAFVCGRYIRTRWLVATCRDIGLNSLASYWEQISGMTQNERLVQFQNRLPRRLRFLGTRFRYVVLALLINLPGSSIIGGGGGIMMAAGVSRLFSATAVLLTLALAVAPVPLLIWIFGPQALFFQR